MWTTYNSFQTTLKGKGYSKGFLPCNCKGTNEYRNKSALAYLINLYPPKDIVHFFNNYDVTVNEDLFALSEVLQWIWRSRIREGQRIVLYLPSYRMRTLLCDWSNSEI